MSDLERKLNDLKWEAEAELYHTDQSRLTDKIIENFDEVTLCIKGLIERVEKLEKLHEGLTHEPFGVLNEN